MAEKLKAGVLARGHYRGLVKNTARLTMPFALGNLWVARRQLMGARG